MELRKNDKFQKTWKAWTKEDELFLEEKFGVLTLDKIARKLGRSVSSVENRKYALQLGPSVDVSDNITAQELSRVLKIHIKTIIRYIDTRSLPAKRKILYKERLLWQINIQEFWKWLKVNEDISVLKMEPNILGKEPEWLSERRKMQLKDKSKVKIYEFWTEAELNYLKGHYKTKSAKDIADYLKKEESAVKNKAKRIGLNKRINLKWQDIEVEMLKEMVTNNMKAAEIAEELGRSLSGVKNKISNLKKKGLLDG